jgi:hypothetical protein
MAKDPTKREVWHPADYDQPDVRAVQSVTEYARLAVEAWDETTMGPAPATPSPPDVKRFLDWIIYGAAQTYDNGFVADDPNGRIGAYIQGRQSVGQQIIKLMRLKPAIFEKPKEAE